MSNKKYTHEVLEPIVRASLSIAQVLRVLGTRYTGGSYSHVSKTIDKLGIDRSHFTGNAWSRGKLAPNRLSPSDILVKQDRLAVPIRGALLRRALLELGVTYRCSTCGVSRWADKDLVLEIDHISGDRSDSRRENLRFLCPNCHSQTATYAGKTRTRGVVD